VTDQQFYAFGMGATPEVQAKVQEHQASTASKQASTETKSKELTLKEQSNAIDLWKAEWDRWRKNPKNFDQISGQMLPGAETEPPKPVFPEKAVNALEAKEETKRTPTVTNAEGKTVAAPESPQAGGEVVSGKVGERPARAEKPPVEGARKAKDGNWYVQKEGKWNRVEAEGQKPAGGEEGTAKATYTDTKTGEIVKVAVAADGTIKTTREPQGEKAKTASAIDREVTGLKKGQPAKDPGRKGGPSQGETAKSGEEQRQAKAVDKGTDKEAGGDE
jgi:hypothetical protein